MLKISGLFVLLMFLSACASSHDDEKSVTVQQPYWDPPREIFHNGGHYRPPFLKHIHPGMTRWAVFHRLGRKAELTHVYHPRGLRMEDWQEVMLPEGRLDLFFALQFTPEERRAGEPVPVDYLSRQEGDRLIRFQFTHRTGWVQREGWWCPEILHYYPLPEDIIIRP